jgi:hypothetical protein
MLALTSPKITVGTHCAKLRTKGMYMNTEKIVARSKIDWNPGFGTAADRSRGPSQRSFWAILGLELTKR